jgi:hypothetical protein
VFTCTGRGTRVQTANIDRPTQWRVISYDLDLPAWGAWSVLRVCGVQLSGKSYLLLYQPCPKKLAMLVVSSCGLWSVCTVKCATRYLFEEPTQDNCNFHQLASSPCLHSSSSTDSMICSLQNSTEMMSSPPQRANYLNLQ